MNIKIKNEIPTNMPLVSVIMAAYNAEIFISKTLNSILAQTYKNIEVIVVDDGSQDKTSEIVESFAKKDHRVILLKQANSGVAVARNLAIENSHGEYIAPIDADDIWYPQNIEKQLQSLLKSEPSVGLVYAWSIYIDENDLPMNMILDSTEEGEVCLKFVNINFIGHASATLIRRECFEQIGGYNTQFREQNAQGCEDFDLYLRIAEKYEFRVVPEILIGYRQVFGSMSCNSLAMEKSRKLALVDFQCRNPEISPTTYTYSWTNFYAYLAYKSNVSDDHWNGMIWSWKGIKVDPKFWYNYKVLLFSIVKMIAKPVSSLIWPNYKSWFVFKRNIKRYMISNKQQSIMPNDNVRSDV
ncbi:glycosyltransferase family 2 protein [Nodularia sphaerocarpa]|uniref:glycosyltransferase family 2 protein n=1 Tax=Nodularia sphaerocarpa TaxID=137816 RepID=UPI001EFAEFC0|nr:glycosyltransferase family A protein [Nodularia sphaerocarpa]MDB9374431.1 glycosyltransferase family A protein [Nodularia sphaerocarpa CS-585]MDB9376942.1 glycosyltransferase family A protein [Nodularia sphaerocarpa CS-585A2]ULP72387.1 putative glycosyltransferase EpsJ [Nodularia sphaerocarpa UHCC 0038]